MTHHPVPRGLLSSLSVLPPTSEVVQGSASVSLDLWNGEVRRRTKARSWPSGSDAHIVGYVPAISADISELTSVLGEGAACLPTCCWWFCWAASWAPTACWLRAESWRWLQKFCTDVGLADRGRQPVPPESMPFSLPLRCLPEVWMASHTNRCPLAWRMTESSVTCGGRTMCPSSSTTLIQRRSR